MSDRIGRTLQADLGATIRRFLIIFLPLVVLVSVVLAVFYYIDVRAERKIIEAKAVHNIDLGMATIVGNLGSIVSDLLILSEQHELQIIIEGDEEERRSGLRDLNNNLLSFSSRKGVYDQIRFLDETGMEVVRVNYNDGNPAIVPEEQLQLKVKSYYFKNTFMLAPGEVFVSPFDLNIEQGEIEMPLKPMIRFGTPVFDSSGENRGIVVLNYLGANVIHNLERVFANSVGQLMLLNHDGFWIKGLKPEDEWGFMYKDRENRTFGNAFGEAWQKISAGEAGQFQNIDGMFTFRTVHLLLGGQRPSSGSDKALQPSVLQLQTGDRYWKLLSRTSPDVLKGISGKFITEFLSLCALLVALLGFASWFLARAGVERKRIEQMKSNFVALASHELRTPLTSILGYVDLILDGDVGEISKEQREFLEIISQNTQRLEALINEVLDIEKIESGRVKIRQEKVNLNEIVEDCINTFKVMAEGKGLKLEKDIKVAQIDVLADSDRLSQVFSNLLSDAIKYTKEGRVKVTAQTKGRFASVTVEDSGVGMSQQDLSRVFTRFFRSDNSYVRKTTGTGLGLSIAKATIERHNGDIKVESKLGVGTKFEVILPLLKEAKKVD